MGYLVCWKDMMKDSDEPLPMRPFDTRECAESYINGCADVICLTSKNDLDFDEVRNDFMITQSE